MQLSQETKQKISNSMKKAHAEGRAHNIGQSRWNNEPSYPEQWFMNVIENEFSDKNYIREYPFFKYSLDFAWPDKKFCVEIDGAQHYRNNSEGLKQQKRDREKDELLAANGWYEIRISWKTICLNTLNFISFVKNAIDTAELKDITKEQWYLLNQSHESNNCITCGAPISKQALLCVSCYRLKTRIVERPTKLDLAAELYESNFTLVAAKYAVSANTIIKWCKSYGLPTHITDIRNWYRTNVLGLPEIVKTERKLAERSIIQQLDKVTLELIAEYSSYAEAAKLTGVTTDNISRVCRGLRNSAGGFKWKKIILQ